MFDNIRSALCSFVSCTICVMLYQEDFPKDTGLDYTWTWRLMNHRGWIIVTKWLAWKWRSRSMLTESRLSNKLSREHVPAPGLYLSPPQPGTSHRSPHNGSNFTSTFSSSFQGQEMVRSYLRERRNSCDLRRRNNVSLLHTCWQGQHGISWWKVRHHQLEQRAHHTAGPCLQPQEPARLVSERAHASA